MQVPDGLHFQEKCWFESGADQEIVQTILIRLAKERTQRELYAKALHDIIGAAVGLMVVHDTKDTPRPVALRPEWLSNFVVRFRGVLKEIKW